MIIHSTTGTAQLGIWPTETPGIVRITNYGDGPETYNAEELIKAIQEES